MSLSQKHTRKVFVPWFNTGEWRKVYNMLSLQSDENYSKALTILKLWKSRTPLLSAGVEGTMILLEALFTEKESLGEYQLTQIYAMSIMRFLNLCATNSEKQGTFYKTALKNELPKWLINIRHDIAHDHRLPSASVLELGLNQCLDWIKIKYWQIQNENMSDYIVPEESTTPKVIEILKIYVQLILNSLSRATDISQYDEAVIEQINDIVFLKSSEPTTDISDIITNVEEYLSECFAKAINDNDKEVVSKIVNDGLLSTELEITSQGTQIIPKDFRNAWLNLLNILNDNNFTFLILSRLVDITNSIEVESILRKTAALWISEILLGLRKAQLIKDEYDTETTNPGLLNRTNISKIKSSIEEKNPEFENVLDFPSINVFPLTEAKEFQDKILKMPNDYTLYYLEKALRLGKNSENYIADTINLVEKLLLPHNSVSATDEGEIFTVDHLPNGNDTNTSLNETDSEQTIVVDVNNIIHPETTRWKPVKDTSIYKGCPLGVSPHQSTEKNPLLEF